MVVEPEAEAGGLARGRVTLLGTCERLPDDERDEARRLYLEAHPEAFYADFGDFSFYRLAVDQIRWVGGFGAMDWIDPADYRSAG